MDGTIENRDCIILAGGKGTRLRSVVSDLPKPMAPINGIPFLEILLKELHQSGVKNFILATGYQHEVIEDYFQDFTEFPISFSVEEEPLGTGGAILKALRQAKSSKVLIVNGDTFFNLNLPSFLEKASPYSDASCVLALKKIEKSDRYGSVLLNSHQITQFKEKTYQEVALINSGIYLLDREWFLQLGLPDKFSFEMDFLEPYAQKGNIFGIEEEGYFIDIGIPEDYARAQRELG